MAQFIKVNDLVQPLRWYDDWRLQQRFLKGTLDQYSLICPPDRVIPFVIPTSMTTVITPVRPSLWAIYNEKDQVVLDLTNYIPQLLTGVYEPVANADGTKNTWLINKGGYIPEGRIPCGYHYSVIVFNNTGYTSEFFYVPAKFDEYNGFDRYIKFTWWNNSDILGIPYQTGLKMWMYLEAELTKMTPEIIEEGTEDGQGQFYPTSQRYIDNFHFDEWASQPIVDAITSWQMHDNVTFEQPMFFNGNKKSCRNFKVSATFDTPGNFALIDVVFQDDTPKYSGACSDNFKLSTGSEPTCNITITNLKVSGASNTKTFLFTPLQNGTTPINVLRYEWRSPQKYNGNWQNIDLNQTFADSFSTGQNTVCVRAVCPASYSTEVCINFTVSLPSSQCPAGIQIYDIVYGEIVGDTKPVGITYSLTGVVTNAQFIEIKTTEISEDWQRFPIISTGTPQYIYFPGSTTPGEYVVQMRVVCVISSVEYFSAPNNFVITLP